MTTDLERELDAMDKLADEIIAEDDKEQAIANEKNAVAAESSSSVKEIYLPT